MSSDNRQITELAKQGLSAQEIAESLGYETSAVEAVLSLNTEVVRELTKHGKQIESKFEDMEQLALDTLKELIQYGDKSSVRMAGVAYVLDQRLDLKKPKVVVNNIQVNNFNQLMEAVKAKRKLIDDEYMNVEGKLVEAAA